MLQKVLYRGGKLRSVVTAGVVALSTIAVISGCGKVPAAETASGAVPSGSKPLQIVTTTPILADLAKQVAGRYGQVKSLVPPGADPHTYEPSLRDVRSIVYADAIFSNNLLLEEQSLIRTIDANLPVGVANTRVAEESKKYGAQLIRLVEDPSLNTVWLGLRAAGKGKDLGVNLDSEIRLQATNLTGANIAAPAGAASSANKNTASATKTVPATKNAAPGKLAAFLTGTFGQPEVYFNSADGFSASDGYQSDTAKLPPDAHTHLSWAFSKPGVYRLEVRAQLARKARAAAASSAPKCSPEDTQTPLCELGRGTVTFAVGVDPHRVPGMSGAQIINSGHMDLTVDVESGRLEIVGEPGDGNQLGHAHDQTHAHDRNSDSDSHSHSAQAEKEAAQAPVNRHHYDLANTVIEVPNAALNEIPANPAYRFLGRPGSETYILAQAVLGKHVHGEIDPHLWQSVPNVKAMVEVIRDTLINRDPAHRAEYTENTRRYQQKLDQLDDYIRATLATIPTEQRNLVTTHDAFGYLAESYGLKIAGFVTSNPSQDPSARDLIKLTRTLKDLSVPAVFVEPNSVTHVSDLRQAAKQTGINVCKLYGDTFTPDVHTYLTMMATNAFNLKVCLDPESAPPARFHEH